MFGRIVLTRSPCRTGLETEYIAGLPLLRGTVCAPQQLGSFRLRRRLRHLQAAFLRHGVRQVIFPADFPYRDQLPGLVPMDVLPLYRDTADLLLLADLARRGLSPARSTVTLAAPALYPELVAAAQHLCPQVRRLVIDVPGTGSALASTLYRTYGLPVTPSAPADTSAAFGPVGAENQTLRLYGSSPELAGLALTAPGLPLPLDCTAPLLAALWACGRLRREALAVGWG